MFQHGGRNYTIDGWAWTVQEFGWNVCLPLLFNSMVLQFIDNHDSQWEAGGWTSQALTLKENNDGFDEVGLLIV